MTFRIPVSAPDLSGNESRYVQQALESGWISSTGEFVARFESEFAEACGARSAISVCNGTAALHLALLTLGIGPGDEVIVPALTFVATANSVTYVGAYPRFVDVDPVTFCIDPDRVAEAITPRTRAIIAVHLYGHPADMDRLRKIADDHGLWLVEDAAQAHFAAYKGRPVGSLGDIATFSFYGNKIIASGEGGAVVLSSPELEAKARLIRGQGMDPARRYYFPIVGNNFRLTNVACAILCAQLERRDSMLRRRRAIDRLYRNLLGDIPGLTVPATAAAVTRSPWLANVLIDAAVFGTSRDGLASLLEAQGIETRPFFIPLHLLPPYRAAMSGDLPVAEAVAESGLSLPMHAGMKDADVRSVARAVRSQMLKLAS